MDDISVVLSAILFNRYFQTEDEIEALAAFFLSVSHPDFSSCQLPSLSRASWEVKLRNSSECSVKSLLTCTLKRTLLYSPVNP